MNPLEDNFNDVIGKAQRGLKITDEQLAQKAGVSAADVARVKAGEFDEAAVGKLAPVLHLGVKQLVALGKKTWQPKDPGPVNGLRMFTTTYGDITVNSFLVWDPKSKAAIFFDTGADSSGMIKAAKDNNLDPSLILLTHTHPDHIADLARLKSATGVKAFVCELEALDGAESFSAGKKFSVGALQIETRQTSGHSRGGITYYITGLARPVAIVGDSIFASSMGGGAVSYEDALRNNREQILTLPEDTIIGPGHGPMTSVGEEKVHNPFFT
jgi:glyoxylase-like metal-dependent hydrolase (beta-lactamase superfamily II)